MPPDPVGPADLVGQRIAHFRVVEKLGEGGMGVVYKAEDETLRRTVALKLLPGLHVANEERRARFMREARSAAAVTHANVATVYEVGEADGGRIFIAMELIEGRTLRRLIEKGPLSISEALHVAKGVARGIAKAHAKGIVHRDLKPDNVMLTDDGEVKVLDFGLAKLREETTAVALETARTATNAHRTKEGRVLGTTGYMSPEQAMGHAVDERTDIFAFGVVLYEMVTGENPFRGESSLEILIASSRDTQQPASKINPHVSPDLERIIDTCLAKKPTERFATAGDLLTAIERLPSSRVSQPPPAGSGSQKELELAQTRLDDAPRVPPSAPDVAASPKTADRSAERRPRAGRVAAIAGAVAVAAALTYALASRTPKSTPPQSAVPPPASSTALFITDAPAPKTASPEAATAYTVALQGLRDASVSMAYSSLKRAVQLDPSFAAARLRLAVQPKFDLPLDTQREHVASASSLRTTLTPRDQALLQVAEAMVAGDTPDFEQVALRARAAVDQFPGDAELVFTLGQLECEAGHTQEAYRTLDRAATLDPHFALPYWEKAICESNAGARDDALASIGRCLSISPGAASCLRVRAGIEDARGECAQLEKDARAMIAIEPRGHRAYEFLAVALAAQSAPVASLHDTLRKRGSLLADETARRQTTLSDEAHVAMLTGAFTQAIKATGDLLHERDTESTEKAHAENADLFSLYEETADNAKALAAARDYANRLPAWAQDAPQLARPFVLAIRHRAGDLAGREYESTRDAWIAAARSNYPPKSVNLAWLDFYARPARTRAEAEEALAALPGFSPLPAYQGAIVYEEAIGHVYLLAGRIDEATPHLRTAANACSVLTTPIAGVRAHAELGEALEARGATDEACREYATVLARWGHAEPRSATADRAKARSATLHCPAHTP